MFSSARRIASLVAPRMFSLSISSTEASPNVACTCPANTCCSISAKTSARCSRQLLRVVPPAPARDRPVAFENLLCHAFEHLGAYSQAVPLYAQALEITQRIASQDPKDLRALYDVVTVLDDQATSYEDAANPILAASPGERRVNLNLAEKTLLQAAADLEQLLKQDPANDVWKAYLANMQARIGIIRGVLHSPNASGELSRKSLAVLREVAGKDQASPMVLDQTANAFLLAEPASLRNAQFAVSCAEREVAMSRGKIPFRLLTLAQAYRASGQIEKSRTTAMDGLALLPALQPGSVKPNIRKLLENEVQTRF